jgi:hypothetical protein
MSTPGVAQLLYYDRLERRAKKRTPIHHGAALSFSPHGTVYACCVCNVTNDGSGIRLNGLKIVPSEFDLSFDNFRTVRRCRLIWRNGDFIGAKFES